MGIVTVGQSGWVPGGERAPHGASASGTGQSPQLLAAGSSHVTQRRVTEPHHASPS